MQQFERNTEASKGGKLNSSVQVENLQTSSLFIESITRRCMPCFRGIMSSSKGKADVIAGPLHCYNLCETPEMKKHCLLVFEVGCPCPCPEEEKQG